ncbi:hypothetical protein [Vibrio sp. VPAP30]|uniref:hypothetical protein n=1 Tax=Vibrio sp. VPAP30 TaxID=1647102 RepID=UPI0006595107|nr:hypothetical protein [Vibrio sp. VPAP30]KLN64849.1 hypothetical protein ZX61_12365 [Vibrio sp. VPAP30]
MDSDEHNVECKSENTLTHLTWLEHVQRLIFQEWKQFVGYLFASIAGAFGVVELFKFFLPHLELNNIKILFILVAIGLVFSLLHCIHAYCTRVPSGLETESKEVHKIVRRKRLFWEYALFHQLLEDRITEIDRELTDILSNRVYVKFSQNLNDDEYMKWLQLRPKNMLKLVEVAKQLFIRELGPNLSSNEENELCYMNIVQFADLVSGLYRDLYEYEVEGRQISAPDDFDLLHEIQSSWVVSIRDGFYQMMSITKGIATRKNRDLSPVEGTITLEEPPRIEEFNIELGRLKVLKNIKF